MASEESKMREELLIHGCHLPEADLLALEKTAPKRYVQSTRRVLTSSENIPDLAFRPK
jgi:hypothetical protein